MSLDDLGPAGRDEDLRPLLARATADATTVDVGAGLAGDLRRGRAALGRRRSVLTTLAVGAGTALVAAGAVLVPQTLAGVAGPGTPAASATGPAPDTGSADGAVAGPAPTPLVAGPAQQARHVVATRVPAGWEVLESDPDSLVLGRAGEVVTVTAVPGGDGPPVLGGVGDFERMDGSRVSYYLLDRAGAPDGAGRPTMVLELTFGRWARVSASTALGWGMAELTAFADGLRAPFACADPCEVPLAP